MCDESWYVEKVPDFEKAVGIDREKGQAKWRNTVIRY